MTRRAWRQSQHVFSSYAHREALDSLERREIGQRRGEDEIS
jgi:hypothetical protein